MRPNRMVGRQSLLSIFFVGATGLVGCGQADVTTNGAGTGTSTAEVVYGTDDRQDVYAAADATLRTRAQQSTVALVDASMLNLADPNNVGFYASTLKADEGLCSGQRFANDPAAAFCSGTLIDDDLVLTAGHCITSASDCASARFVFNYYRTSATALHTITTQDIFSCASIVTRQQATVSGRQLDFGVIRLDRPATPRFTPAPVRSGNAALANGQQVGVIGCGSGIPFKVDAGGAVRTNRSSTLDYFTANTDTFAGNSGSGVYELTSYTLAGILVRGDTDYVASGSCNVVNVCSSTGCRGEDSSYVATAISSLCSVASSARLCGTTPPTQPPSSGTSFTYSASNTNNATTGTTNKSVTLAAGDTLEVGTCTVTGSAATGDTYLLLYSGGTQVAANDDSVGQASYIKYVAPAAGAYEIRAGCYANTACSGTVAWKVTHASTTPPTGSSGSFTFTASNTNSAQTGTVNKTATVNAGQTIQVGTCTVTGASGTGDTYLRLYGASATQVASNDDSCGVLSYLSYTVPAGKGGSFQIKAGCYSNTSCSGTVAYTIQ